MQHSLVKYFLMLQPEGFDKAKHGSPVGDLVCPKGMGVEAAKGEARLYRWSSQVAPC
jgi:hypothetical protein